MDGTSITDNVVLLGVLVKVEIWTIDCSMSSWFDSLSGVSEDAVAFFREIERNSLEGEHGGGGGYKCIYLYLLSVLRVSNCRLWVWPAVMRILLLQHAVR